MSKDVERSRSRGRQWRTKAAGRKQVVVQRQSILGTGNNTTRADIFLIAEPLGLATLWNLDFAQFLLQGQTKILSYRIGHNKNKSKESGYPSERVLDPACHGRRYRGGTTTCCKEVHSRFSQGRVSEHDAASDGIFAVRNLMASGSCGTALEKQLLTLLEIPETEVQSGDFEVFDKKWAKMLKSPTCARTFGPEMSSNQRVQNFIAPLQFLGHSHLVASGPPPRWITSTIAGEEELYQDRGKNLIS
ncbi:hypothetical protein B0H11DRAFT_1916091 [Mycena galericulata]|nr:hypothetical protein B0H11DRAFT_1916091 [Mycena galericulata]